MGTFSLKNIAVTLALSFQKGISMSIIPTAKSAKKMLAILIVLKCMHVQAQDTEQIITYKSNEFGTEWLKSITKVKGRETNSIYINGFDVWVSETIVANDSVIEKYYYNLEVHLPPEAAKKWNQIFFPIEIRATANRADSPSEDTFYIGDYPYPCQCLALLEYDNAEPDLACILNCEFDTSNFKHWVGKYNKRGDLDSGFYKQGDNLKTVEVMHYDDHGRKTAEFAHCDTFYTTYNEDGRKLSESFNYGCDDFRYVLQYEYADSFTFIYGIQEGNRRLTSKLVDKSDGTREEVNYFSDSSITIEESRDDLLQSKEKWIGNERIEKWIYTYHQNDGIKETLVYKNEIFQYKIVEK